MADPAPGIGYYALRNPDTGEFYVGSGILEERKRTHFSQLRNGSHPNYRLQAAFDRNPQFQFDDIVVDESKRAQENRDIAAWVEQQLIDQYRDDPKFLNLALSVEACFLGRTHTEEAKAKNSESKKAQWSDPEYREKMSTALREGWKNQPPERREAFRHNARSGQLKRYVDGESSPTKGQKRSEEFCQLNRERALARNDDPVYKQKHHEGMLGNDNAPRKEVVIEGVEFPSITAAAQHYGMTKQGVIYRLETNNEKFKDWTFKV